MGRFNIVFDMGKPLYAKDTKIIIERAVLTKDNDTGKVFAQIKMSNLLSKTLIAVKVSLTGYDVSGEKLEEKEFSYLDLTAKQGEEFGQKTPVDFQNSTVRSFNVKITETVYSDGSKFAGQEEKYYPVPEPESLKEKLTVSEIEQYKQDNVQLAKYAIKEFSDLWICTCGEMNTIDNDTCYSCGAARENLKRTLDKDLLDEEIKEGSYKKATDTYQPGNRFDIETAIRRLKTIEGYKDSKELIARYEAEIAAIDKKTVDEAKARKRIIGIFSGIAALCVMGALIFNFVIIPNKKLNNAEKLINEGEYEEAYVILDELGKRKAIANSRYNKGCEMIENGNVNGAYMLLADLNYKDSKQKIADISTQVTPQIRIKCAKIDDTVELGNYHGAIEWLVLDKQDGKVLLISKYCLDVKRYSDGGWAAWAPAEFEADKCTIRQWLNNEFISETFSNEEKILISDTYLQNKHSPSTNIYCILGEYSSTDRLFLLSIDEVEQYFAYDGARETMATNYAKEKGIIVSTEGNSPWWLRTTGYNCNDAVFVQYDGSVDHFGANVDGDGLGVRPAMWINVG